jgi:hypothetical protein
MDRVDGRWLLHPRQFGRFGVGASSGAPADSERDDGLPPLQGRSGPGSSPGARTGRCDRSRQMVRSRRASRSRRAASGGPCSRRFVGGGGVGRPRRSRGCWRGRRSSRRGDAEVVEGVGDAGAPGFGGVAPAPVGGGEVVADLDQPAAVDGLEGEPAVTEGTPRCRGVRSPTGRTRRSGSRRGSTGSSGRRRRVGPWRGRSGGAWSSSNMTATASASSGR